MTDKAILNKYMKEYGYKKYLNNEEVKSQIKNTLGFQEYILYIRFKELGEKILNKNNPPYHKKLKF